MTAGSHALLSLNPILMFLVKLRWSWVVAVLLLIPSIGQATEVEEISAGFKLNHPLSFVLKFENSAHFVVGASQYYGDFKLTLKEQNSSLIIREVNASSDKGFDELMLVSRSDCTVCVVELSPTMLIDSDTQYSVWVNPLDSIVGNTSSYSDAVVFFEKYTSAMEFFEKAAMDGGVDADRFFQDGVRLLEEVVLTKNVPEVEQFRNVAVSLLADAHDHIGNESKFDHFVTQLVNVTHLAPSLIGGYALYDKGVLEEDLEKQRALYDQAIVFANVLNDKRLYAKVANRKAMNLTNDAKYGEAFKLLLDAREINRSAGRLRPLVKNLGNLSWASLRASNLPQAIKYAAEATLISEKYNYEEGVLLSLYYSGIAYARLGEYFIANQFLDKVLERQSKLDTFEKSSFDLLRGAIFEEQAKGMLEYDEFDIAISKARSMRDVFQKLSLRGRVADADSMIGEIALRSGQYSLAREKLNGAVEYDRNNNRTVSLGNQYLKLAELELELSNLILASNYLNKALNILSLSEDKGSLFRALSFSVELLRRMGGHEEAWTLIEKLDQLPFDKVMDDSSLSEYLYRSSLVALSLGKQVEALDKLKVARSRIEIALAKIKRRDLKRKYLAIQKSIYEKSIDILMSSEIGDLKYALELAESFKARTLEESLADDISLSRKTQEQEIERSEIHSQLLSYALTYHRVNDEDGQPILESAKELSVSLEVLEQKILAQRQKPNVTSKLKRFRYEDIDIDTNELLAVYFTGSENSWLWQVNNGKINGHRLPREEELNRLVGELVEIFSTPPSQRKIKGLKQQAESVQSLSKILIGPLISMLIDDGFTELTVIPDGVLFSIPFAALSVNDAKSPLIDSISVSYAPSLTSQEQLRRDDSEALNNQVEALIFANAGFSESSATSFGTVPFSEIEADFVQKIFGSSSRVFKGAKANRQQLSKSLEGRYRVIHFATHGLLNSQVSNLSGLSFPSKNGETSLWLLPEISNTKIQSELVFLSACETAIGKHVAGEGLMGLSRAFLEAGANNVVGTLWNVQDKVTSELVRNFYRSYSERGYSFDKALQHAQQQVIANSDQDWSDPYYWAGFQLMGGG